MRGPPSLPLLTMMGPLLLLSISLLGPPVVLSQSQDDSCSCLDLAHVRTLIPDNADEAKQFLSTMRQYSKLDLCKIKWQDLPLSTLSWIYKPRRGQDVRLGEFLQKQAGELKNLAEKYFWKNWQENEKMKKDWDPVYNLTWILEGTWLNKTTENFFDDIDDNINRKVAQFKNDWDNIFPNLGIVGTYALENRDKVFPAITAFACAWSVKLPHASFPPVYMEALENMDEKQRTLLIETIIKKWMEEIIFFQGPIFLKNSLNKLESLLLGLIPHLEKFPSFVKDFWTGKQPNFENLIIRILEEAQTDEFLNTMDQLVKATCTKRREMFRFIFDQFIRIIRNEHNFIMRIFVDDSLDLIHFDKHWEHRIEESRNGRGSDIITRIFKNLHDAVENIETSLGTMFDIPSFLELLLPNTSPRYCPGDAQLVKENGKMFAAGLFNLFMYKFFFNPPNQPPPYGYGPPPGYQYPPPPGNTQYPPAAPGNEY